MENENISMFGLLGFLDIEEYIFGIRNRTIEKFDLENKSALSDAQKEIYRALFPLMSWIVTQERMPSNKSFHAYVLINKALNIIVSSLHLIRQRSTIEPLVLLRVALESACTAIHIYHEDQAYSDYQEQKYKSSNAVTYSKRYFKDIGKIWGDLSNKVVHINSSMFGPKVKINDEATYIQESSIKFDVIEEAAPNLDKMMLTYLCLISTILQKFVEIIFMEGIRDNPEIYQIKGSKSGRIGVDADHSIKKYCKKLEILEAEVTKKNSSG